MLVAMALISLSLTHALDEVCRHGAVAIGNFDGVHRGHQAIVAELQRQARAVNGPAVAVTFDPHPLQILRPEQFQPVLTTIARRAEVLHEHGADHVVILPTSPALLQLTAHEFFEQILRLKLGARAVVEGFNFCFGHNREGTIETLQTLGRESSINVSLVPPQLLQGQPISSSRVRRELEQGRVREAIELLGRPYQIQGVVSHGQQRGASIGFPTANLDAVRTLLPRDGVYAVRAQVAGGTHMGAANIGANPTFGEHARKVEAHLIGYHGDLYGQTMRLDFLERLRDTRPFAGVTELQAQLQADVDQARRIGEESGAHA
jgi:riboflavin kinase / FMN adenylyltransferase